MKASDGVTGIAGEVPVVELEAFYADLDHYLEAAEAGQEFWLARDGTPVCHFGPAYG